VGWAVERKARVTGMRKLSEQEIEKIVSLLKEGKPLPEDYKAILFDTKKEYELMYANKEREEDILADTMAVPLQGVKTFRNGKTGNGWMNMLIFGDNLQVLKTLLQMKHEGKLKNADGMPGVRLVYIDPPFGTGKEYEGNQGQLGYSAKVRGAQLIEFVRRRLVILRELMSSDGVIFVRQAYNWGHYVKLILDEVFERNFINEVIINRKRETAGSRNKFEVANESIFIYSTSAEYQIEKIQAKRSLTDIKWTSFLMAEERFPRERTFLGATITPPSGQHFSLVQEKCDRLVQENYIRLRCRACGARIYYGESEAEFSRKMKAPKEKFKFYDITADTEYYLLTKLKTCPGCGKNQFAVDYLGSEDATLTSNWLDIPSYTDTTGYPTENSELLLQRVIECSSNEGDLVLDCFAGSGTTLAVAEKLGRRWIGVDCGKLAIYTMQKRFLNIAVSKDIENPNKKFGKPCQPFTLYNAGLYDYKMIKELPWEQYRDFALKLFQCRDERHEISKIELDGRLGADSVLVFNYQKHKNAVMDRGFIDDLHRHLGEKIGRRFFIIAPAASVQFLEDYIEKGRMKYFVLRIPYSIIEEIHNRGFTKIKQPVSEMDVNDTVDAVGFDFIQVPTVECKYLLDKPKKIDLLNQNTKECVIKIERFESKVISRKPLEFANLETLSTVMLDYDFDGEVFGLDEVFYAEDLKKNGYEVRFAQDKVKGQIMVIYIDIFGNEKREVKTLSNFDGKKK
jgi:site-specific DNA-methyltransferase (adenine-specific)/adenine-specific DNA-methyltransferase